MRSDKHTYSDSPNSKQKKLIIIAICILLVGFAVGGSIIGSYYSDVNFYNSEEGAKLRAKIDKDINELEKKQQKEWIENDRSEKYYAYEDQINALIEQKNQKPPTILICYGIFPMIGALTVAIPLLVFGLSKKKE